MSGKEIGAVVSDERNIGCGVWNRLENELFLKESYVLS